MTSLTGDAAVRYGAAFDWCVRPAYWPCLRNGVLGCSCPRGVSCAMLGKHPMGKWNLATVPGPTDPATLARLWRQNPWANIALLTGARSGVVVGDVDPRHGGTLDALWALGWPQDTVIAQTGGGGWHVYVRNPVGGLATVNSYAPGVELKAEGSLVIAPPSAHPSERRYRWLSGHAPWDRPVAYLPETVRATLDTPTVRAPGDDDAGDEGFSIPGASYEQVRTVAERRYRKALYLVHEQGWGRNNTAYWLARQLRSLGLSKRDAEVWVDAFGEEVGADG
jgi:Bifunctional DNA primase/polymerase, N-terminal